MFRFFQKVAAGGDGRGYSVPAGRRIYAIGDVHGRADLLNDLLALIDQDNSKRSPAVKTLIFLGDLVDRGCQSAQVVQSTCQLQASDENIYVIKGNHEEAMLAALDGNLRAFKFFLMYGGAATLRSYNIPEKNIRVEALPDLLRTFISTIPPHHVDFLRHAIDFLEIGDYFFTHAGVRPGVSLSNQAAFDLRWIREPFLSHSRPFPKLIVHGHTPEEDVQIRSNRIGIDTGAFETGRLTAIGLENEDMWFVQT
ncbi:serine/threonine protein phosphatase [Sphingomonas crocodyli]|uniref:Serine/threonine protein phosphatase n=1 Tax=Sphingomonas crocodyli TaxID=1979270 RepID=A0A437LYP0_9SPHN|nr:serine/threonine protein phosphatase [Sphingomonas crocodyli]